MVRDEAQKAAHAARVCTDRKAAPNAAAKLPDANPASSHPWSAVMSDRDHTGRNIVLVGGAGLAAWWLLSRGKGWGFRGSGDGRKGSTGTTLRRAVIWVRANRIEVDGVAADLSTVIATARAAGEAEVHATGDAITRSVRDVVLGLRAAGVTVYLAGDLGRTNWEAL